MKLHLETTLKCSFEEAVKAVMVPQILFFVARPIVCFVPDNNTIIPEQWAEETYWFKLRIFGILPIGRQAIRITYHNTADSFVLRDNGYSRMVEKWDHTITISKFGTTTQYCDDVNLSAGTLTPFVWLFAYLFYNHRQRRWLKLTDARFQL